jgi:hypothetical protein
MKTKSNLLLILSIALFVILIIGKPLVVATKNYFINTTTTCEFTTQVLDNPLAEIIPKRPVRGGSTTTIAPIAVDSSPTTTVFKMPERGSGSKLPLPCGFRGIQDIDYQYNDTYNLNIFNTLKALSLSLIALALFIRYKQRI